MFECLDSIEALEILLELYHEPARPRSPDVLSHELRLNVNSVTNRLRRLHACGLLVRRENEYAFDSSHVRNGELVAELDRFYRTHRHRVLETIISPMKKAHDFAQAFRVRAPRPKGEDPDDC